MCVCVEVKEEEEEANNTNLLTDYLQLLAPTREKGHFSSCSCATEHEEFSFPFQIVAVPFAEMAANNKAQT